MVLTPKLGRLNHTLEWVCIEDFDSSTWGACGRLVYDHGLSANAFVAKAVLGLPTTVGLIERLIEDRAHAALVRETLGDWQVGHISRDGTA